MKVLIDAETRKIPGAAILRIEGDRSSIPYATWRMPMHPIP
jgi:hypothetical protein